MAARVCFVDYDREATLCAEVFPDGEPLLIAVARLVADPDHQTGDFGILVADAYQRRGLGKMLTQRAIEIGKSWGLRRIFGETTTDNAAMIHIFHTLGFQVEVRASEQIVLARMEL
jgi:acetyltransferase